MHLINLSLDQNVFGPKVSGDTHYRFIEYATVCETFSVIVPTQKADRPLSLDTISYYPTSSGNKLFAYLKIIPVLFKLLKPQTVIVTNDPVLGFFAILAKFHPTKPKVQISSFGTRLNQVEWLWSRPHHWLLWLVTWISLRLADSVRTDTRRDVQIISKFTGKPTSKFVTIPVVPTAKIQQRLKRFRSSKLTEKKKWKFLAIGSLSVNKDFATLIRALSFIPTDFDWQLRLIGSGQQERNLKSLTKKLGLDDKIEFEPNLSYEELMVEYKRADVFVSSSKIEGLPRVLQEAALAALPIVVTDFNGAADLITNNDSGLIVPISNPEKLGQALTQMITYPVKAREFGRGARNRARVYCDFDTNLKQLTNSWKELVK